MKARKELTERLTRLALDVVVGYTNQDDDFAVVVTERVHQCPYTMAQVTVCTKRMDPYVEYGFCKVSWPDRYDVEFGFELAVKKAVARIVKAMMSEKGKN